MNTAEFAEQLLGSVADLTEVERVYLEEFRDGKRAPGECLIFRCKFDRSPASALAEAVKIIEDLTRTDGVGLWDAAAHYNALSRAKAFLERQTAP